MLRDTLNFIKRSYAKNSDTLDLQYFAICDRRIEGFNGCFMLGSPIDLELDACPKAEQFISAIETFGSDVDVDLSSTGKLRLKTDDGAVFVDCIDNFTSRLPFEKTGEVLQLKEPILPTLKKLLPFVSKDISRKWSRGILFKGNHAYATNNIVLIKGYMGFNLNNSFIVPVATVAELIRISEEPLQIIASRNSLTFIFSGERFLRTTLIDDDAPDFKLILSRAYRGSSVPEQLDTAFYDTVKKALPFLNDMRQVFMTHNSLNTSQDEHTGFSYKIALDCKVSYNADQLLLLKNVADCADLSAYPEPAYFTGPNVCGVLCGMV